MAGDKQQLQVLMPHGRTHIALAAKNIGYKQKQIEAVSLHLPNLRYLWLIHGLSKEKSRRTFAGRTNPVPSHVDRIGRGLKQCDYF